MHKTLVRTCRALTVQTENAVPTRHVQYRQVGWQGFLPGTTEGLQLYIVRLCDCSSSLEPYLGRQGAVISVTRVRSLNSYETHTCRKTSKYDPKAEKNHL